MHRKNKNDHLTQGEKRGEALQLKYFQLIPRKVLSKKEKVLEKKMLQRERIGNQMHTFSRALPRALTSTCLLSPGVSPEIEEKIKRAEVFYHALEDYKKAEECYSEFTNSKHPEILCRLGDIKAKLGKPGEAKYYYELAIEACQSDVQEENARLRMARGLKECRETYESGVAPSSSSSLPPLVALTTPPAAGFGEGKGENKETKEEKRALTTSAASLFSALPAGEEERVPVSSASAATSTAESEKIIKKRKKDDGGVENTSSAEERGVLKRKNP